MSISPHAGHRTSPRFVPSVQMAGQAPAPGRQLRPDLHAPVKELEAAARVETRRGVGVALVSLFAPLDHEVAALDPDILRARGVELRFLVADVAQLVAPVRGVGGARPVELVGEGEGPPGRGLRWRGGWRRRDLRGRRVRRRREPRCVEQHDGARRGEHQPNDHGSPPSRVTQFTPIRPAIRGFVDSVYAPVNVRHLRPSFLRGVRRRGPRQRAHPPGGVQAAPGGGNRPRERVRHRHRRDGLARRVVGAQADGGGHRPLPALRRTPPRRDLVHRHPRLQGISRLPRVRGRRRPDRPRIVALALHQRAPQGRRPGAGRHCRAVPLAPGRHLLPGPAGARVRRSRTRRPPPRSRSRSATRTWTPTTT